MESTLLDKTIKLLREDHRTLVEIYDGCGLSIYWLRKMKAGNVPDPSVRKVQALYEFLSNKTLEV